MKTFSNRSYFIRRPKMSNEQYSIDNRKRKQFTPVAQNFTKPDRSLKEANQRRILLNYIRPFIKKDARLFVKRHKDDFISNLFEIFLD